VKKENYTVKKLATKVKGHGYLKKTKLGLVSGIILASSLFVSLGSNTFVLAEETNTNSTENVAPKENNETKDKFVREETVSVKEAELKAKVEEVKKSGVTVEEKPGESVGVAKTETEEATLKKNAETKVDEQIKALEEAKKEEKARKAKAKKVEELKEYFIENKQKKDYLITHLISRDAEIDEGKSKIFSDFSSNKEGGVYFVNVDTIDLTSKDTLRNMGKNRVTNDAKKIHAKLNTNNGIQNTDAYIFKVRNGETISYNAKILEDSYLSKKFGIDSISIKRTYNFGFTNQARYYDVLTNNLTETNYIFTNIDNSTNPNSGTPHVTTEYLYKDKLGKVISLKELYIKVINDGIFYNNELLNSENISDESLKKAESGEKFFGSNSKLYSTGYSVTETAEGGVAKTINYFLNPKLNYSSLLDNTSNAIVKSNILKNVDYKKLMEPISTNYHLVTYKKLIDTGVVQQKFVDEQGNEIAPTITSEKIDNGSTVAVTTPPKEITYKGQMYLLQTEKIPNSLVIEKGINSVTFSYKLQVVSDKGTPERLEVPEYISKKGEPLTLEVPEYSSKKGEPLVQPELPAFELNNEQPEPYVEVPKPQQEKQTKKSTFDETSKKTENEVQTSSEKPLPAKQEKEVVHQTESEKVVSNKQVLPNTGMSDTSLYYTISASIMSLLGMMSLKFKKKDMK
jgi:anchor protein